MHIKRPSSRQPLINLCSCLFHLKVILLRNTFIPKNNGSYKGYNRCLKKHYLIHLFWTFLLNIYNSSSALIFIFLLYVERQSNMYSSSYFELFPKIILITYTMFSSPMSILIVLACLFRTPCLIHADGMLF